jgi:hypothetical protein
MIIIETKTILYVIECHCWHTMNMQRRTALTQTVVLSQNTALTPHNCLVATVNIIINTTSACCIVNAQFHACTVHQAPDAYHIQALVSRR